MPMRELRANILDVGHGDGIVLEIPIGDANDYVYGVIDCNKFTVVRDFLDDLGADRLAFVVATHPHIDHIRGIQSLLNEYDGRVDTFWDSGYLHPITTYKNLLTYLTQHEEIPIGLIDSGTVMKYGKTVLNILAPPWRLLTDRDDFTNVNNASIVIKVVHGDSLILLGADAQFGNWSHMRAHHKEELRAQALKVSHHGSKHGTFLEALEIVSPNYVIISAGTNDPDAFPHESTMESIMEVLGKKGYGEERVFNTAVDGNVTIRSTGLKTLNIDTEHQR
ncbi:MAG: hypothetical protein RTV31_17180 [Candidatus Thorarchaeota archaeon]